MYLNNCHLIGALSGGVDCQSGYVEIRDGRISSVGEQLPEGAAEVYDCGSGTLLPGLIDLHTHITLLSNVGISCSGDPMQVLVDASAQAKRYLRHGFTTIRDCGSIGRAANYVKKLIAGGVFDGPDLITCGSTLMPSVQMKRSSPLWTPPGLTVFLSPPTATPTVQSATASGLEFTPLSTPPI